ncbi:MAG: SGNH/GDSL hydrolase family protein, partial [Bacteroidales bacterium]|nr:SGNH/GDSL hydrolase family protein [Bacteroidales bacterium]
EWLDDHPEATTTVQDGSITEAKLAQDVLAELGEIDELKEAIVPLTPSATSGDVGKFLKVKTVADGAVTEYEFGSGSGGGAEIDDTAGIGDTDKVWSADKLGKEFVPETSTFTDGTEYGYYRVTQTEDAIEEVYSASFKRCKVEIQPWMGKYVEFSVNGLVGNSYAIYCGFSDENDDYISKNAYVVGSQKLEIPSNAKYIYMSFYGSTYNSDYVVKPNKVIKTNDLKVLGVENPFIGTNGVAFGTSLTYRAITNNGYLQYLPGLSGATIENQGISSAGIGSSILPAVKAYTGYSSKQFVIIEGFVNDWTQATGLGEWNNTSETTACGCMRSIINYILSQNPKMTIFVVLDHYGRSLGGSNCSSTAENANNQTQYEYYEEISKVCASLGIPVIKQYAESQMCENTPDYFYDQIHPNELGAKQSAYVIWQAMKRYGLRVN